MDRRRAGTVLLALAAGFSIRAATGAGPTASPPAASILPQPGPRDLCPVCGMLVAKYPAWVAIARYRDGHAHFFDGAKDLFKYLFDLPRYAPGHRREDLAGLWVTEFYGLTRIDAKKAWYVIGSDVLGPMGHEFVPLASRPSRFGTLVWLLHGYLHGLLPVPWTRTKRSGSIFGRNGSFGPQCRWKAEFGAPSESIQIGQSETELRCGRSSAKNAT